MRRDCQRDALDWVYQKLLQMGVSPLRKEDLELDTRLSVELYQRLCTAAARELPGSYYAVDDEFRLCALVDHVASGLRTKANAERGDLFIDDTQFAGSAVVAKTTVRKTSRRRLSNDQLLTVILVTVALSMFAWVLATT